MSSSSKNVINRPLASEIPRFLAPAAPRESSCRTTLTRRSKVSSTGVTPPSSTIRTSKSEIVWPNTLLRLSLKSSGRSRVGMITENKGEVLKAPRQQARSIRGFNGAIVSIHTSTTEGSSGWLQQRDPISACQISNHRQDEFQPHHQRTGSGFHTLYD